MPQPLSLVEGKPGTSYFREIITYGFWSDQRSFQKEELEETYKNTKAEFLDKKLIIPIVLDHERSGDMKGYIQTVEMKLNGFGQKSLWSRFFLFEETAKEYEEGKYPNLSPEINRLGMTHDGNEYTYHLAHISLLGAQNPAMPWLYWGERVEASIKSLKTWVGKKMSGQTDDRNNNKENIMPKVKEKLEEVKEYLAGIMASAEAMVTSIDEVLSVEDTADPPTEEEVDAAAKTKAAAVKAAAAKAGLTDLEKKDAELKASIEKREAELFKISEVETLKKVDEMIAAGKLKPNQVDLFKGVVGVGGLQAAVDMFDKNDVKTPPTTPALKVINTGGEDVDYDVGARFLTNDPIKLAAMKKNREDKQMLEGA